MGGGGVSGDVALFWTTVLVVSGYGIPFVLRHNGTMYDVPYGAQEYWQGGEWTLDAKHHKNKCVFIEAGAGWLTVCGNTVIFLCILFFHTHFSDDDYNLLM